MFGPRVGPQSEIRKQFVDAFSRVLDDGLSVQEAMDEATEIANQSLADYNAFFE